ncbi:DNA binding domain-containing protein, excisionase family [Actinoplanes philippinensis]|uniref:DNA binding domain-containing protein, excisionase family n=2 Tax=Actinoplanes philippinensis TaxID=35752 RepID=A0A1I2B8R1_9ACTN|nr:DNA binding domain-containing protein, excisionase family [Actinoplanes philippinensis]
MLCMTQVPPQETASKPELLTAKEAGEALGGVSDETVNRWARDGRIACITLPSGQRRFRREVIDAILAGNTAA